MNNLTELKNQYQALTKKAASLKTKAARQKCWDKKRSVKLEFNDLSKTATYTTDQLKKLNIMAMVGGPMHVTPAIKIEVEVNYGSTLQVAITYPNQESRYAGTIDLLNDYCGIDNLKILRGGSHE